MKEIEKLFETEFDYTEEFRIMVFLWNAAVGRNLAEVFAPTRPRNSLIIHLPCYRYCPVYDLSPGWSCGVESTYLILLGSFSMWHCLNSCVPGFHAWCSAPFGRL